MAALPVTAEKAACLRSERASDPPLETGVQPAGISMVQTDSSLMPSRSPGLKRKSQTECAAVRVPVKVLPVLQREISRERFEDCYKMEHALGRGKFAVVKLCERISTGEKYAAKVLRKTRVGAGMSLSSRCERGCEDSCTGGVRCEIMREVDVLSLTRDHDRFITLIEVFESARDVVIVTDLVMGGDLYDVLREREFVSESETRSILHQTLDALDYLHSCSIVHMDVKPPNILLTHRGLPVGNVKLCDLGLARHICQSTDTREIIGTPDYVAPEVLNYEPLRFSCDVWSIGVLAYVLLSGFSPFAGDTKQETFLNISQLKLDFTPPCFQALADEGAVSFIRRLLVLDPDCRPTAAECLTDPWLTNIGELNIRADESLAEFCLSDKSVNDEKDDPVDDSTSCSELSVAILIEKSSTKIPETSNETSVGNGEYQLSENAFENSRCLPLDVEESTSDSVLSSLGDVSFPFAMDQSFRLKPILTGLDDAPRCQSAQGDWSCYEDHRPIKRCRLLKRHSFSWTGEEGAAGLREYPRSCGVERKRVERRAPPAVRVELRLAGKENVGLCRSKSVIEKCKSEML